MKKYSNSSPEFSEEIDVFEATDPGHADMFNTPVKQLYGNTLVLKQGLANTVQTNKPSMKKCMYLGHQPDYTYVVIGLVRAKNLHSSFQGRLYFERESGIYHSKIVDFSIRPTYGYANGTAGSEYGYCDYLLMGGLISTFKPCKFTYNNVEYLGFYVFFSDPNPRIYIDGFSVEGDSPFMLNVYNKHTGVKSDVYDTIDTTESKFIKGLVIYYSGNELAKADGSNITSISGNAATASAVLGTYSGSGGQLPPSAIHFGNTKFIMANGFKGLTNPYSGHMDMILMDNYSGSDVPWVTGIGVYKMPGTPRMMIANGAKGDTDKWANQVEVITTGNIGAQTAGAAARLDTPRKIGNADFDGTKDISLDSIGAMPDNARNNVVQAAGWYRFAKVVFSDSAQARGAYDLSCDIDIKRTFANANNETYKIQFFGIYQNYKFVLLGSRSNQQLIQKIRYTVENTGNGLYTAFLELYYSGTVQNGIECVIRSAATSGHVRWMPITMAQTQEAAANTTVYKTFNLLPNFDIENVMNSDYTKHISSVGSSATIMPSDRTLSYSADIGGSVGGLFPARNNANSILNLNRHPGKFYSQLGFSSNGNLYYRYTDGADISNSVVWKKILLDDTTAGMVGAVEASALNNQRLTSLDTGLKWRAFSGPSVLMTNKIKNTYSLDVKPFLYSGADDSGYGNFNNYFTDGCKIYATISISDQLHKVCVDLGSPNGGTGVTGSAFSHIRNNGFLLVELGFSVDVEDGAWTVQVTPTQTEYRFLKDGTFSIKGESELSSYVRVELRELSFAGNENIDGKVRDGSLPGCY